MEGRGKAFDKLLKQGYNHFILFTQKKKSDASFFMTKDGRVCGRKELNDNTVWGIICKKVKSYRHGAYYCASVVKEV
jgi:hypothetical protein